ncbi:MAG: ABC transporter ATP-binding protein [Pseudomonadales bacterium]|nr:ABC transporter ATP-binding protein [Pseudomonadales bacterium]
MTDLPEPSTAPSTESSVALEVAGLSWGTNRKQILDDISFTIPRNQFVGIIGPNGAGKSSLLRCLYRKTYPDQGSIKYFGKAINHYSRRALARQIAVVLQEAPAQFDLSARDVIAMGLTPHKSLLSFESMEDRDQIINAARQVDMEHQLQQEFNALSGGEKQRVMIARAIVQKPSVLLMDEPTNHLDVHHQIEVLELARAMNITVLVSIHDLNLAAAFCDRLILLNQGAIVADGAANTVLTEHNLAAVFNVNAQLDRHPFAEHPRITYKFRGEA